MSKSQLHDGLMSIGVYLMLLAFHGYRFGDQDMMESLSYTKYLLNPQLYANDLYIQAAASSWLNERFPTALFFAIGGEDPAWFCYLVHVLSSIGFIWASLKIARHYLPSRFWELLFVLTFLFISYGINLGENEAWYNYIMPSYLAKTIGIWSIYLFVIRQYNWSFISLIAVTLFHPIVGAQLALLFGCVSIWMWWQSKWSTWPGWQGMVLYGLTAGLWIGLIFYQHQLGDQTVDDATFYEIMELRLGHHFFPGHFSTQHYLILIPLFVWSLFYWRKLDQRISLLFVLGLLGMLLYTFLVEVIESPHFLSVQWFKINIWLKPLSIIALYAYISSKISFIKIPSWSAWALLIAGVGLSVIQWTTGSIVGDNKPYFLPFVAYQTDEMKLASEMKEVLPIEATLLIPPHLHATRYLSGRSLYIDYKSNIHSRAYMAEATRRRELLYGMTPKWRKEGLNIPYAGLAHYRALKAEDFLRFKAEGATHVMVEKAQVLELPEVMANESFVVYQL